MIIDKNFRRPVEILVFEQKNFFSYLVKSQNNNSILFYSIKKKKTLIKKIRSNFTESLLLKLVESESFGEIDKSGSQLILREVNGKIIKKIKISKKILNIECLIYNHNQRSVLVLDSKLNQIIRINISKIHDVKISFQKYNKSKINFENSKLCSMDNDEYIFSNNEKLYLLDSKFNKIRKLSKPGRDGPYTFRKISSIKKLDNKIIICDTLNYKIKFYDLNLKFFKFIGGKGIEINRFDLPVSMDIHKNTIFIADKNNDRILSLLNTSIKEIIKTDFSNKLLRRPVKIIEYKNDDIATLDRDNSRVILLKKKKNIFLKKYKNGKLNSFGFLNILSKTYIVALYRFSNLKNKILVFDMNGQFKKELNLNLKDAQDISIFNNNLAIADTNNRSLVLYNFKSKLLIKRKLINYTLNKKLLTKTVCWDRLGNLYTADFDKCIVLKFDRNLKLLKKISFKLIKNKIKIIRCVYIKKNFLFILNRGINPILVYDLNKSKIIKKFSVINNQKFFNPTSIVVSNKNLYVADKENDKIIKIKFYE